MSVDVLGELSILGEGGAELRLSGRGERIAFELPSLRAGRSLSGFATGRAQRQRFIDSLQAGLRRADLTLEVTVAGRAIARLAPDSRASLLTRLLGLGALEIHPLAMAAALLRR